MKKTCGLCRDVLDKDEETWKCEGYGCSRKLCIFCGKHIGFCKECGRLDEFNS